MIKIYKRAEELPVEWDSLVKDNYALYRESLGVLELVNPCNQNYAAFYCDEIDSAIVTYKLKINIFSYSKLKLELPITVIGIPCSVSKKGYVLGDRTCGEFEGYLNNIKGAKLILNTEDNLNMNAFAKGITLPTCSFKLVYKSFEEYLNSMRSHYRYRHKKALKKAAVLEVRKLEDNSFFDEKIYSLYESVYDKSQYKLEKLTIEFFRNTQSDIYVFYEKEEPVAFVQLKEKDKELYFLFGGLNYKKNKIYDLYENMLMFIVRQAYERKCISVDFGQTAEDSKMKIGCSLITKYMYVGHSNKLLRCLIKIFVKILSYKEPKLKFNLFK